MLKVMYEREARPAGRAAMAVYLIRHGETDWNRQMRLQGRRDIEMNETGIAQVRRSARALAALGVRPDVIVASPLSRARRSAEGMPGRKSWWRRALSSATSARGRERPIPRR